MQFYLFLYLHTSLEISISSNRFLSLVHMSLSFSISCLTNSISFLSTSISFYLSCVQLYLFIFPSKLKYPLISFNLQFSILSYLSCIQFYFFLFLHTSLKISISSDRFLSLVHMSQSFSISCLTNSISFLSTSISFYLSCVQLYLFLFLSQLNYPLISFNLQFSIPSYLSCIQFYLFRSQIVTHLNYLPITSNLLFFLWFCRKNYRKLQENDRKIKPLETK